MRKNNKAVIALSGGVDSALAGYLLKKKGYDLVAVFMKLHPYSKAKGALKTAKKLNIPLRILDLQKEFKEKVIDYFIKDYEEGRTPNPCVVCNKEIKFGLLREKFPDFLIATGHYARIKKGGLFKGRDKEKDQSYFLWQLNQEQLKRIIFPLGNFKKKKVKKMAKKIKLPVWEKPESQEICFIEKTLNEFLKKHLSENPGKIVAAGKRKVIGQHKGLHFYTIGQRKGLNLSGGPWYVLKKDLTNNLLIITKNEEKLMKKSFKVKNVNWIKGERPSETVKAKVKIRYGFLHLELPAEITPENEVIFKKKQRAITPGQSAVFYKGKEILGGGIIENFS